MSIENQFSKHANNYNSNNIIQQIVSKALVREIGFEPKRILELGCGSGQVFKNISWDIDYYKAIDFSTSMCEIHPKAENLEVKCFDFDSRDFYDDIKNESYDIVLSSSAMQWSKNLDKLVKQLSKVSKTFHGVLFTSHTFKTIQDITKKKSPILDLDSIKNTFLTHFTCEFEVFNYNLEFDSKKKLFSYIKNSGVSGDSNLNFKEAKNLYKKYDKTYLEFEVVFIKAKN
jgi:malonyl-CoA O-methyltransferase